MKMVLCIGTRENYGDKLGYDLRITDSRESERSFCKLCLKCT